MFCEVQYINRFLDERRNQMRVAENKISQRTNQIFKNEVNGELQAICHRSKGCLSPSEVLSFISI